MVVLGISCSWRKWGNTEILVRHALRGAESEGAESRFLRLSALELRSCTGCMACVFKECDCVLEDRFGEFLEALRGADAVVMGSPAYVLGATGVLKNLQDRMIRFGIAREFVGKLGLAVAPAGVPGWEPFVLQQLALFFLFLGMPVVDQFVGYAQGPGEILDDEQACERAVASGAALGRGEAQYRGDPGTCPVCHLDLVTTRQNGSAYCVPCDLPGAWVSELGGTRFQPEPSRTARWREEVIQHHFLDKLLPSGARFKARKLELRDKVVAFQRTLALGSTTT